MGAGTIRYITALGQPSFDEEVPQGQPQTENPFGEAEPTYEIITQLYWQRAGFYRRPQENDRCPPTISRRLAYFVDDSARVPLGVADIVTWTRTWATKPAQIVEYEQIAVQMPALAACYFFDIGTAGGEFNHYPYIFAKSYSLPRRATILRDFFLIGTSRPGVVCDYAAETAIPALNETIATAPDVTSRGAGPFDNDSWTDIATGAQNVGYFSGAIFAPPTTNPASGNVTNYATALAAGNYYVGQSVPRRLIGNIWERTATRITI